MNQKKGHKLGIIILIILVPLLIVGGIGLYKIKNPETIIEETTESEKIEEIVKEQPSEKKNQKPPRQEEVFIEEPEIEDMTEAVDSINIHPEIEEENIIIEDITAPVREKKELKPIYITHCKSLLHPNQGNDHSFPGNSRLSAEERDKLHIHQINGNFQNAPIEQLVSGKIYYDGENGKLVSIIYLNPDGKLHEYLIALSSDGKYVTSLEIGLIVPGTGERKHATLSVNKLSVFEVESSKGSEKREEKVTEFYIDPHLRFNKGKTFSKLK